jgi:hypothetical protein
MSGLTKPLAVGACPFCGMAAQLPHETQAACIAALHEEIGRTRDILASLKPAGAAHRPGDESGRPPSIRLALSDNEVA